MGKVIDAIDGILGIIPPLVWAMCLVVVGLLWFSVSGELKATNASLKQTQDQLAAVRGAVVQQKKDAAAQLAQLRAERDALQAQIDKNRTTQEAKDAKNRKVIADQAARLRALADAHGGQLRDPNATGGCGAGGGGAQGEAAGRAGGGAGDGAQAGGLLSAQLSGLLQRLEREADAVNVAYDSCRADAMNVRGLAPLPAPADPATEPAAAAASP